MVLEKLLSTRHLFLIPEVKLPDIAVAVMDISQISHMEKIVEEYTDLLNASSIVTYTDKREISLM